MAGRCARRTRRELLVYWPKRGGWGSWLTICMLFFVHVRCRQGPWRSGSGGRATRGGDGQGEESVLKWRWALADSGRVAVGKNSKEQGLGQGAIETHGMFCSFSVQESLQNTPLFPNRPQQRARISAKHSLLPQQAPALCSTPPMRTPTPFIGMSSVGSGARPPCVPAPLYIGTFIGGGSPPAHSLPPTSGRSSAGSGEAAGQWACYT